MKKIRTVETFQGKNMSAHTHPMLAAPFIINFNVKKFK
jgi:hypothetical protein